MRSGKGEGPERLHSGAAGYKAEERATQLDVAEPRCSWSGEVIGRRTNLRI